VARANLSAMRVVGVKEDKGGKAMVIATRVVGKGTVTMVTRGMVTTTKEAVRREIARAAKAMAVARKMAMARNDNNKHDNGNNSNNNDSHKNNNIEDDDNNDDAYNNDKDNYDDDGNNDANDDGDGNITKSTTTMTDDYDN
jgi:hypothetical protein